MRKLISLIAFTALLAALTPTSAFDINAYRRTHNLPPLAMSGGLSGIAQNHAMTMASSGRLSHDGFRQRMSGSAGAENVAFGCPDEDCAFRMWTRSAGHRRNMLLRNVSSYGVASATAADGRRYWVLELGN